MSYSHYRVMKWNVLFWTVFSLATPSAIAADYKKDILKLRMNVSKISDFNRSLRENPRKYPEIYFLRDNEVQLYHTVAFGSDVRKARLCLDSISIDTNLIPPGLDIEFFVIWTVKWRSQVQVALSWEGWLPDEDVWPTKPEAIPDEAWELIKPMEFECLFDAETNELLARSYEGPRH